VTAREYSLMESKSRTYSTRAIAFLVRVLCDLLEHVQFPFN